jgi:hypothetical protein
MALIKYQLRAECSSESKYDPISPRVGNPLLRPNVVKLIFLWDFSTYDSTILEKTEGRSHKFCDGRRSRNQVEIFLSH